MSQFTSHSTPSRPVPAVSPQRALRRIATAALCLGATFASSLAAQQFEDQMLVAPPAVIAAGGGGFLGRSLAMDGNTLVAGAPDDGQLGVLGAGAVQIFTRSGGTWSHVQNLVPTPGVFRQGFGSQRSQGVALSGNTLVVGTHPVSGDGRAFVYERSGPGAQFLLTQTLVPSVMWDGLEFGTSVGVDGDVLAIGNPSDDAGGTRQGAVYIYERAGGSWSLSQVVRASDAANNDALGWAVSVSNGSVLVGANEKDQPVTGNGAAYVFVKSGSTWVEQRLPVPAGLGYRAGYSCAIDGDTAVVGAILHETIPGVSAPGAGYVFTRTGSTWSLQAILAASDGQNGDELGTSIAIDGDVVVIGAGRFSRQGYGYSFVRNGCVWTELTKHLHTNAGVWDSLGYSAAVSGDQAAFGAPLNTASTGTGSVYTYTLSTKCQPLLGFQGPGTAAASICGTGLNTGESSSYYVSCAPANAVGVLFVSVPDMNNLTLYPNANPGVLVSGTGIAGHAAVVTDGNGELALPMVGFGLVADLVFQTVFLDPAVLPHNLGFTNAVLAQYGQ